MSKPSGTFWRLLCKSVLRKIDWYVLDALRAWIIACYTQTGNTIELSKRCFVNFLQKSHKNIQFTIS